MVHPVCVFRGHLPPGVPRIPSYARKTGFSTNFHTTVNFREMSIQKSNYTAVDALLTESQNYIAATILIYSSCFSSCTHPFSFSSISIFKITSGLASFLRCDKVQLCFILLARLPRFLNLFW